MFCFVSVQDINLESRLFQFLDQMKAFSYWLLWIIWMVTRNVKLEICGSQRGLLPTDRHHMLYVNSVQTVELLFFQAQLLSHNPCPPICYCVTFLQDIARRVKPRIIKYGQAIRLKAKQDLIDKTGKQVWYKLQVKANKYTHNKHESFNLMFQHHLLLCCITSIKNNINIKQDVQPEQKL